MIKEGKDILIPGGINYSDEEKSVGIYKDGRPVYQIMVECTSNRVFNTWSSLYDLSKYSIDKIVNFSYNIIDIDINQVYLENIGHNNNIILNVNSNSVNEYRYSINSTFDNYRYAYTCFISYLKKEDG